MERPDTPLCVIVLTYTVPLDQVDAKMAAHVEWLEQGYEQGIFLASGRRTPRTGGVILARGDKAGVEAVVTTDPFVSSGAAEAEVIAFTASMAADGFTALLT